MPSARKVIAKLSQHAPTPVAASIEVSDITRAYYDTVGWEWWIRTVRLDPNELIVDNEDEGKLYRVPFTLSGETVTFGKAVEVKIHYDDVAATLAGSGRPVAVFASKAESRPAPVRATATPGQVTFGGAGHTVGQEGPPAIANVAQSVDSQMLTQVRTGTVDPPPAPKEQPDYPAEWVPELKMVPGEVRHFAA